MADFSRLLFRSRAGLFGWLVRGPRLARHGGLVIVVLVLVLVGVRGIDAAKGHNLLEVAEANTGLSRTRDVRNVREAVAEHLATRSAARRVGKEGVSTCRTRGTAYRLKNKQ